MKFLLTDLNYDSQVDQINLDIILLLHEIGELTAELRFNGNVNYSSILVFSVLPIRNNSFRL